MALKQMSLARMGEYRPPVRAVGDGGKTGRMKLLHNGPGNGISGGGGLNAKGTGGGIKVPMAMRGAQRKLRTTKYKTNKFNALKLADRRREAEKRGRSMEQKTRGGAPMAQHPVGRFQYGHDQWAFINARGLVNWNSTPPKSGQPVVGFNQVLPWLQQTGAITKMPQRRAQPAYYEDSIYARQMADRQAQLDQSKAAWEYAKGIQEDDYKNQLTDLRNQEQSSRRETVAGLSGSNLSGSGIAAAALGQLASQFQDQLARAQSGNLLSMNKIQTDLQNAQNQFNTGKAAEQSVAKDRWLATHPGEKAPKTQGLWDNAGQSMYTNPNGIPMTWGAPKPKKPKFPNAKTFKDANGVVRPIVRK